MRRIVVLLVAIAITARVVEVKIVHKCYGIFSSNRVPSFSLSLASTASISSLPLINAVFYRSFFARFFSKLVTVMLLPFSPFIPTSTF